MSSHVVFGSVFHPVCWKRNKSPGAFVMVDSGSSGGDSGIPLMGVVGMPNFLVWGGAER